MNESPLSAIVKTGSNVVYGGGMRSARATGFVSGGSVGRGLHRPLPQSHHKFHQWSDTMVAASEQIVSVP